ncbi:response regulator [Anaeromyxobacter oryzisoli]|uniref:response regulator n=1 Tax=Anaeromyxobacter oryzisoli TaxID=2925408 RepID=UPI001F581EF9|nr:response regulator [Anaeromyxobacter sp. SG63]
MADAPKRKVLLIEDDGGERAAVAELLSSAGFGVVSSDEGRKALELAAAVRPQLVILDLVTEGMNGWEFLERRRGDPALRDVPVIVLSGRRREPLDVDLFLSKPVAPEQLLRAVRTLISRGRARR